MLSEEKYRWVVEKIQEAAIKNGRDPSEIRLVVASKFQTAQAISEIYALGQRSFGENYVQEWQAKVTVLNDPSLRWHLIGPLQRNKVKFVVGKVAVIETIDRLELAKSINEFAQKLNLVQSVLIELNVGNEATKHGVAVDKVVDLAGEIRQMSGLRLQGLMSLPPLINEESTMKKYFSQVRAARDRCCNELKIVGDEMSVLSMGTSQDFGWAIAEGATIVRVGTSIFGPR